MDMEKKQTTGHVRPIPRDVDYGVGLTAGSVLLFTFN